MWKDYSVSYIKKNRASSVSIMVAAFISALFLSLICSLFYNLWKYDVESVVLEKGDWQGRITGELGENEIATIENFPNVKKVTVNENISGEQGTAVELYFYNSNRIYQDMPLIVKQLGFPEDKVEYNAELLSQYLIQDPQDDTPPMLLSLYLVLLIIVMISLILIIRNSFAVSMNERIHQFGIFSSVGAAPGQIRLCLMQEAAVLCLIPILVGSLLGIGLSFGVIQIGNAFAVNVIERHEAVFGYQPFILIVTILVSVVTVFISTWLPARKTSKLTTLEAIRYTGDLQMRRKKHSRILSLIFGIEGELAGNSLKARKRALRTTILSLTLAFFAFTAFLCFVALSSLSVKYTYFERYKNSWDMMATLKDTAIADFEVITDIAEMENIESVALYQKATAYTTIDFGEESDELLKLGGIQAVAGDAAQENENGISVKVPIVILDDKAFGEYCVLAGIEPSVEGGIVINRIWDSIHSNFRYKEYIPFVKGTKDTIVLENETGETAAEIPIIGYTETTPILREEYDNYALVQILPLSFWNTISGTVKVVEPDSFLRILTLDDSSLEKDMLAVKEILETSYKEIEIENRVGEQLANEQMWRGYKLFMGAGCVLLAVIGISNIFSNALGFLYQRKREFARYISIGMTPKGIRKILWIEAITIAGKPLLITVPLTALFVVFAVKASYLNLAEFMEVLPIGSIIAFIIFIFVFVGLAYYIGGKRLLRCELSEALRDDVFV